MTLSEFAEKYPQCHWLEDSGNAVRYSNGLDEDTEHESVWFCIDCEAEVDTMEHSCIECGNGIWED